MSVATFRADISDGVFEQNGDVINNVLIKGWYEHGVDINLYSDEKMKPNNDCISGRHKNLRPSYIETFADLDGKFVAVRGSLIKFNYIEDLDTGDIGVVSHNSCNAEYVFQPDEIYLIDR